MKRVVVIGAGPAGSAAAMALAATSNIEVLLLEKAVMPRRKVCGSGLSPWTLTLLDELGVGSLVRKEAYLLRAAKISGSRGPGVGLRSKYEIAVLLRERFDLLLAHEAARRGTKLCEGVLVKELVREHERLIGVQTDQGGIEADAAIVCTGAKTRLTTTERPGRVLHTIMGWYEGVEGISDAVEIYYDPVVKPHYGWVFPEGPDRVNIGLCYDAQAPGPNARERFEVFLERRLAHRMGHAQRIEKLVGHPIATTHQPVALAEPGVLIAGEAGKLVDPSSAEGIYFALASGTIAGRFLGAILMQANAPSRERLAPYTDLVRRQVGRRLRGGHLFLNILETPALDVALTFGSLKPVQEILTRAFARV